MAENAHGVTQIKFKFHARRDEYKQICEELLAENPGSEVLFEISISPNAALRPLGVSVDE